MGKDYMIVDFLKLDPKLFSLLDKRENGFGGYSVGIQYCGKKLYVRYKKRQCRRGVVRWDNGMSPNYSIAINLSEADKYIRKADELDSFFLKEFGSIWRTIVRGETVNIMDFKIPLSGECTETKFFAKNCGSVIGGCVAAENCVPMMSNVRVLALWDNVSIGDSYGAVIRPKAMQIGVYDIPNFESDDCCYIDFPEVYSECFLEEEYCLG